MNKGKLTYYAAKKFNITRRTIYRWIEEGVELQKIEDKMKEVGNDVLITPTVAARILNVTVQTIYRWINSQKLECFELFFNAIRIRKQSLYDMKDTTNGK
jgi:transposase